MALSQRGRLRFSTVLVHNSCLSQTLSEVNAQAWAQALYQYFGFQPSSTPVKTLSVYLMQLNIQPLCDKEAGMRYIESMRTMLGIGVSIMQIQHGAVCIPLIFCCNGLYQSGVELEDWIQENNLDMGDIVDLKDSIYVDLLAKCNEVKRNSTLISAMKTMSQELGCHIGFLHSGSRQRAQKDLDVLHIRNYVKVVVTSSALATWRRPYAELYDEAISRLGCGVNTCVVMASDALQVLDAMKARLPAVYAPPQHYMDAARGQVTGLGACVHLLEDSNHLRAIVKGETKVEYSTLNVPKVDGKAYAVFEGDMSVYPCTIQSYTDGSDYVHVVFDGYQERTKVPTHSVFPRVN